MQSELTTEELANLKDLMAKMTPGIKPDPYGTPGRYIQSADGEVVIRTEYKRDNDGIVALVNAAPALLVSAARAAELEAEVARLQRALVDHNDQLRSAAQVAHRNGADTNWLTFRGCIHYTLAEHHEITNEARAALGDQQ